MRNKHNGGFSLVEVLVAIVLLGLIVIPICSSMLVAHRINAKAEALLQAELAVSSAAERYYATGNTTSTDLVTFTKEGNGYKISSLAEGCSDVRVWVYGG